MKRVVSMDLKEATSMDTVDSASNSLENKASASNSLEKSGSEPRKLGFDLMSLTSRRGHFVDQVYYSVIHFFTEQLSQSNLI